MFLDPWLNSNKGVFDDAAIAKLLNKQHTNLSAVIAKWAHEGSGWSI